MRSFGRRYFLGRALILLVAAAALSTASIRAAEPLPSEISDQAFWKMIVEMSEPDGAFQFENFLSNELGYQYVIPRLLQGIRPGGVYIGVAPEQNFTYIAALKPRMVFIIDIRRQNMIEMLMYKAIFEISETRADFISNLFARKRPGGLSERSTPVELFEAYRRIRPDPELERQSLQAIRDLLVKKRGFSLRPADIAGESSIEYVYSTFVDSGPSLNYATGGRGAGGNNPTYEELMQIDDGEGQTRSFLATEENYRFVRNLHMKNLIIPLVGDFAGPRTIRAVGSYLKEHDAVVTAFYLSNVEQYLFSDFKANDFYMNVAELPLDSSSTFIRSFSGGGGPFRFKSTIASIKTLLEAFNAGRLRQYSDVKDLSQ